MSTIPDDGTGLRAPPSRTALGSAELWSELARGVGLAPDEPVVLGLSGGADSVYLLHLLAEARPRPRIWAVHVDHGLRGDEGRADLDFCAQLSQSLGIYFIASRLALDARAPSLEARARKARYAELCAQCAQVSCPTLLTAHQRDDALETMILRWLRGTDLFGLSGLRPRVRLAPACSPSSRADANANTLNPTSLAIDLVRPLLSFERDELRRALAARGLAWREDSTNASSRFTRNRVRNVLLPWIQDLGGTAALQAFVALERSLADLDLHCAALTPEIGTSARHAQTIGRSLLAELPPILCHRVLWRSVSLHTGRAPARHSLAEIEGALRDGRNARVNLRGGWNAVLGSTTFALAPEASTYHHSAPATREVSLEVPGRVDLGDGRELRAEWIEWSHHEDIPRSPRTALLDARDLAPGTDAGRAAVTVRLPRPGDRFHALGAPGPKALTRFLRDARVPREARSEVWLVVIGNEIAWVAGVRPSHARRVRRDSRACLRLTLSDRAGDFGEARG